jgi:hypothetical protein
MAESNIEAPPVRRLDFSNIAGVLLRPGRGLEPVAKAERPLWNLPMLVLSVTTVLAIVASGYFRARAAMMGTGSLPQDFQYWSPEMQQNYYQAQQAMQGPVFLYVIPLVGALVSLWLGWLILGGLLHLASTLLGGRGSMGSALNVAGYAMLPFAVRDVLRIIFMLISQHAITSPGLSGFTTNAGFWAQLLSHADVFLLWQMLLLIMGMQAADDLRRDRAVIAVAGVVLVMVLVQSGLGSLSMSLGGMAVQRPFF